MITKTEHQFALMDGMQMAVPYPEFLVNVMVIAWSGFFVVAFLCLFRSWRGRYAGVLKYFVDILTCTFSGTAVAWSIRQCLALPAEWQGHRPGLGTIIALCILICLAFLATTGQGLLRKLYAFILCFWFALFSSALGTATAKLLLLPADAWNDECDLVGILLLGGFLAASIVLSVNGRSYPNMVDRVFENHQKTSWKKRNGNFNTAGPIENGTGS